MINTKIDELIENTMDDVYKYHKLIDNSISKFKKDSEKVIDDILESVNSMIDDDILTEEEASYYIGMMSDQMVRYNATNIYDGTMTTDDGDRSLADIIDNIFNDYKYKYKWLQNIY